jgi:DNA (cytosine-5)-methyltransferase 1
MGRPRLLDLFCGQGGAGWGYHLAGFDVTGVDIRPMPMHPPAMEFVHGDALTHLAEHGQEYDAIHASPPCRAYTNARHGAPVAYRHPDLIGPVRDALRATGRPYVIENVPGAPLEDAVVLCGAMFGLKTYRHRLFETNWPLKAGVPTHPRHTAPTARMGRAAGAGEHHSFVGNFSGLAVAREVMQMPWANQDGIRQAVPPVYTELVGASLMAELGGAVTARRRRGTSPACDEGGNPPAPHSRPAC